MATDIQEPLALQTATSHVAQFNKQFELVTQLHYEAMDCCECEAFLQLGIDAFRWLLRADYGMRQAIYSDSVENDPKAESVIMQLFRDWVIPAGFADKWANLQTERGNEFSNVDEFHNCFAEAREIVEAFDDNDTRAMSDQLTKLRDRAIYEQQHGETAEFF